MPGANPYDYTVITINERRHLRNAISYFQEEHWPINSIESNSQFWSATWQGVWEECCWYMHAFVCCMETKIRLVAWTLSTVDASDSLSQCKYWKHEKFIRESRYSTSQSSISRREKADLCFSWTVSRIITSDTNPTTEPQTSLSSLKNLQCQIASSLIAYNTIPPAATLADIISTARTASSITVRWEEQPSLKESSAATCSSQSTCLDRLTSVLHLDTSKLPHVSHDHSPWQT